jgi:predicted GIY-YIG superfamily endonuclease
MSELIEQINSLFINISTIKTHLNYMKKVITIEPNNEDILRETEKQFKHIRRSFETTLLGSSMFPFGIQYVYVWELEEGKYYVGWSENLSRRLEEHQSEEGALWTKKYKPISIIEICRGTKSIERAKTLEYMKLKGWNNVRGGPWCSIEYKKIPSEVEVFCNQS